MLHEHVQPHAAGYVQEAASGDLHELVFIPERRRFEIDTVSTWGEHSPESRARLMHAAVERGFPDYRVARHGPSWWRGDRRVANACRAQVSLRDVLLGTDIAAVKAGIDRLQTIAALMEKQSRVGVVGRAHRHRPAARRGRRRDLSCARRVQRLAGSTGVTCVCVQRRRRCSARCSCTTA